MPKPISPPPPNTVQSAPPRLHHNWEDWLPFLEDSEFSDVEKRNHIETLCSIIDAFVDLDWNIGTTAEICGEDIDLTTLLNAVVLNSKTHPEKEDV